MTQAVAVLHDEDRQHVVGRAPQRGGRADPSRSRGRRARTGCASGRGRAPSGRAATNGRGSKSTMTRTGGQERRSAIVDEAIRQFGRDGYNGASLDDIANAVGVRKQTLLYYFPNKDALLEACLAAAGKRLALEMTTRARGRRDLLGQGRGRDPRRVRPGGPVAGVPDVRPRGRTAGPGGLRPFRGRPGSAAPARHRLPADGHGPG